MKNKIIFFAFIIFSFLFAEDFIDLVNKGINFLKVGEFKKSIDILEEARRISPENPDIYYYLGQAYFRDGNIENAISNLQKAINLNSKNPSYYYTLGLVYLSQNKYKEATENLNKAIEISPLSFYGKEAKKLKQEIEREKNEIEMTKKWEKLEIEEKKRKEEEKKKQEQTEIKGEGFPLEPGIPGMEEVQKEKIEKIPVKVLVKRIKFGRESVRKNTSEILLQYSGSEISPFIKEIIEATEKEKNNEIKRNLILVCGKVNSPEVIEYLLSILKDETQSYAIRIVALESIGNLKTEQVMTALRETLSEMVERRNREREEAKKNIETINKRIDELTARRIFLNSEIQNLQTKKSTIEQKLSFQPLEMMGFGMPGPVEPMPGPVAQPEGKPLTESEIKKLRAELKKIEGQITKNNEELQNIEKELQQQQSKLRRYEELLAMKERKIEITSLNLSSSVQVISPERTPEMGIPPGMQPMEMPQFTPAYTPTQQELDEEKNEVIFAVKIMTILADMRDKDALSIIKKAWREFGVSGLRMYYYISLGKLGEYRGIDTMVERLKQDFPTSNIEEEIFIRTNIIEVLGEYLKENPDKEISGLIEYLAEEAQYPQMKQMAKKVLSFLKKQTIETTKAEE